MYRIFLPLVYYLGFHCPVVEAFLGGKSSLSLAKVLIAPVPGNGKTALSYLCPYRFRKIFPDTKTSKGNEWSREEKSRIIRIQSTVQCTHI